MTRQKHACMVAYTFYDSDNRVRRYAETLAQLGWKVDAIVLRDIAHEKEYILNGVRVIGIQNRETNEKQAITYLLRLLKFLIKSAVHITMEHIRHPYNIVHAHSVPDFEVFAALVPKLTGSKIILDVHDIVPELFCKKFNAPTGSIIFKLLVFVERASGWFADHVIIANDIWRKRIIARSIPSHKCSVVMNYPVPEIFGGKKRDRGDDGKFILIYPGTLSHHQGIETAILAVNNLKDEIREIEFHIYGKGTDEQQLFDLAKKLDLHKQVIFHGGLPLEKIADVMVNADVGVEPKLANAFSDEAFSTKILEFMFLGVPVIASDTTVHKYYIGNDLVEYFHAGSVDELTAAIRKLYKDPAYRNVLAKKSMVFIQDFSWDRRKSAYLELVGVE